MSPDLARLSVDALEDLYAAERALEVPRGVFRGRVLARLPNAGARRLRWRATQVPMFEWVPFGIDFDRRRWFFGRASILVGRFDATIEPSRWRPTEVVALRYDPSRLPGAIKRYLYDEVKPLGDALALGLGGVDAAVGEGDHFFFSLERVR